MVFHPVSSAVIIPKKNLFFEISPENVAVATSKIRKDSCFLMELSYAVMYENEMTSGTLGKPSEKTYKLLNLMCWIILKHADNAKKLIQEHKEKKKKFLYHPVDADSINTCIGRVKIYLMEMKNGGFISEDVLQWWLRRDRLLQLLNVVGTRYFQPNDFVRVAPLPFVGLWLQLSYFSNTCSASNCHTILLPNLSSSGGLCHYMYVFASRDIEIGEKLSFSHIPSLNGVLPAPIVRACIAGNCITPCSCKKCERVVANTLLAVKHVQNKGSLPVTFGTITIPMADDRQIKDVLRAFISIKLELSSLKRMTKSDERKYLPILNSLATRAFDLSKPDEATQILVFAYETFLNYRTESRYEMYRILELFVKIQVKYSIIKIDDITRLDSMILSYFRMIMTNVSDLSERCFACYIGMKRFYQRFREFSGEIPEGKGLPPIGNRTNPFKKNINTMIGYYLHLYVILTEHCADLYNQIMVHSTSRDGSLLEFVSLRTRTRISLPVLPTAFQRKCIARYADDLLGQTPNVAIFLQRLIRKRQAKRKIMSQLQSAIRGKLARLLLTELYKRIPVTMETIQTTVTTLKLSMEKFETKVTKLKLTMETIGITVTTLKLSMEKIETKIEKSETAASASGQQFFYDYHVYHFNLYYSYALFHYQQMCGLQRQLEEQRRIEEQLLGYFDEDGLFIPYQYDDFE